MRTNLFLLAAAAGYFVVATVVGMVLLRLAGWGRSQLAPAVAPAFGAAGLGIQLWAFGLVGIPWNALTLLGPWMIVGLLFTPRLARMLPAGPARLRAALRPTWAWLLLGLAALLLVPELTAVVLRPVVGNDAIAIWLMRARIFQDLGRVELRGVIQASRHPDYPPLFSLMTNTVWVLTGAVTQQLAKIPSGVLLVSLAWAIHRAFRPVGGAALAAVGVLALVALPSLNPWLYSGYYLGYADFATGCWMGISALAMYTWLRNGESANLALALSAALLAALTKNEGLLFLLAVGTLVIANWRSLSSIHPRKFLPVAVPLACLFIWRVVVITNGSQNEFLQGGSLSNLEPSRLAARAVHIADFAVHLLDVIRVDFGWVVLAGLVSLELAMVRRDGPPRAIVALVVMQAVGYFLVYLLVPGDVDYYLNTSADRLTVQILPMVIIGLLAAVAPSVRPETDASLAPPGRKRPAAGSGSLQQLGGR